MYTHNYYYVNGWKNSVINWRNGWFLLNLIAILSFVCVLYERVVQIKIGRLFQPWMPKKNANHHSAMPSGRLRVIPMKRSTEPAGWSLIHLQTFLQQTLGAHLSTLNRFKIKIHINLEQVTYIHSWILMWTISEGTCEDRCCEDSYCYGPYPPKSTSRKIQQDWLSGK